MKRGFGYGFLHTSVDMCQTCGLILKTSKSVSTIISESISRMKKQSTRSSTIERTKRAKTETSSVPVELGKLSLVYPKPDGLDFQNFVKNIEFLGISTRVDPDVDLFTEFVDEIVKNFVSTTKKDKPNPSSPEMLESWRSLQQNFEEKYDMMLKSVEIFLARRKLINLTKEVDVSAPTYSPPTVSVPEPSSQGSFRCNPDGRFQYVGASPDPANVKLREWGI